MENKKFDTKKLVGIGLLTAIVVVLQLVSLGMRFGMFSITFVLIPLVVGSALYGWKAGAWLGLVFGAVVLITGDAAAFLMINPFGAIVVCLLKGMLAGTAAGLIYKALCKKSDILAVIMAAIATPIVNTGIFLLGCCIFFMDTISEWAAGFGYDNVGVYMILGLVGINFVIEFGINLVLNPVIVKLIKLGKNKK